MTNVRLLLSNGSDRAEMRPIGRPLSPLAPISLVALKAFKLNQQPAELISAARLRRQWPDAAPVGDRSERRCVPPTTRATLPWDWSLEVPSGVV